MQFKIIARAGYGEVTPLLIIKEEIVAIIEAKDEQEIAEKIGGKIIQLEGENCLIIPKGTLPELFRTNEKFVDWWKKATVIKIGEIEGKLFIIKT